MCNMMEEFIVVIAFIELFYTARSSFTEKTVNMVKVRNSLNLNLNGY